MKLVHVLMFFFKLFIRYCAFVQNVGNFPANYVPKKGAVLRKTNGWIFFYENCSPCFA